MKRTGFEAIATGCGALGIMFALWLTACDSTESPAASSTCQQDNDCSAGLVCDVGYCIDPTCQRGTKDCACNTDGTCDIENVTPMSCISNRCVTTASIADGALGGACKAGRVCDGGLVCTNGVCEESGCPSGLIGCPCAAYGTCEPYGGQGVRCDGEGRCAVAGCIAGSLACGCTAGTCADGLHCSHGVCLGGSAAHVTVGNELARACELAVLLDPGEGAVRAVFGAGVLGRYHVRPPRVGLSFFAASDSAMSGNLVTIETVDGSTLPANTIEPASVECFDEQGRTLANPQVGLR